MRAMEIIKNILAIAVVALFILGSFGHIIGNLDFREGPPKPLKKKE